MLKSNLIQCLNNAKELNDNIKYLVQSSVWCPKGQMTGIFKDMEKNNNKKKAGKVMERLQFKRSLGNLKSNEIPKFYLYFDLNKLTIKRKFGDNRESEYEL